MSAGLSAGRAAGWRAAQLLQTIETDGNTYLIPAKRSFSGKSVETVDLISV